ncbi:hypothetical protein J2Z21_004279 [Streptomyces griseochromogenes]|uniref:Uncharacterized protein n=1 Tax=Streptomyces griseochromogenes TaxID=68214 RepID=A0A1B1AVF1_9ACTN|nr:hypothetical protein [Streptomyces griseochromogenes]ANP50543.1 hypothetical protein AVL59_13745 [Streptomyces griseochromogenes]MBP2051308.1 hypothetical protein [Streptomyces griseochromogenes]
MDARAAGSGPRRAYGTELGGPPGGTFLPVARALGNTGHNGLIPWYAAACAALGIVGVFLIRHDDLYDTEPDPSPDPS